MRICSRTNQRAMLATLAAMWLLFAARAEEEEWWALRLYVELNPPDADLPRPSFAEFNLNSDLALLTVPIIDDAENGWKRFRKRLPPPVWGNAHGPGPRSRDRQLLAAIDKAHLWLAYHQEPDGHWDAKKHGAGEKTDTAMTALALLTILRYGHSEKVGMYKENVKLAVKWLKSKQNAQGLIFDQTDAGGNRGEGFPHALATLALAEASGMANIPETRAAAQKAVDYCTEIHQGGDAHEKAGWRYHPKMEGDLPVTGAFVAALKAAKVAGLHVKLLAFEGAIRFLDSVEHKSTEPGKEAVSTYWYMTALASEPRTLAAIGCHCRQLLGFEREYWQASVEGFIAAGGLPEWKANGQSVDLYYWYHGSRCARELGGSVWKRWSESLKTALIPNQRKDGDDTGSWDPVGVYSSEWGRVGQTALGCLCLEVFLDTPLNR